MKLLLVLTLAIIPSLASAEDLIDFQGEKFKKAEEYISNEQVQLLTEVCARIKAKKYDIEDLLYEKSVDVNKKEFLGVKEYSDREFGVVLTTNIKLFNKPELLIDWLSKCKNSKDEIMKDFLANCTKRDAKSLAVSKAFYLLLSNDNKANAYEAGMLLRDSGKVGNMPDGKEKLFVLRNKTLFGLE